MVNASDYSTKSSTEEEEEVCVLIVGMSMLLCNKNKEVEDSQNSDCCEDGVNGSCFSFDDNDSLGMEHQTNRRKEARKNRQFSGDHSYSNDSLKLSKKTRLRRVHKQNMEVVVSKVEASPTTTDNHFPKTSDSINIQSSVPFVAPSFNRSLRRFSNSAA